MKQEKDIPLNPGVTMVTASAGSGKTHQLTKCFIRLLLDEKSDGQTYRHILAVTFTNKATDEMKSRIIKELYKLSTKDEPQSGQAAIRLRSLLYDYSCFSVCTIDKFFQNVLRAFAREVGQYASYRLEVEEDDVLTQVVDELIASTEEPGKENLLKWLRDYSIDLVEQGRNWRFNRDLKEMASQFLKESFMLQCRQLGQDGTGGAILGDKERLRTFLHKISGMIAGFENDALRIAGSIKEMMDRHGVTYAGLKAGQKQPMLVFRDWLAGKYTAPDEDLLRESVTRFPGDQTALSALVAEGAALYNDRSLDYFSARAIRGNLYLMGIYRELQDTLNAFLRENNVVILPLANDTLSRIIGNDDAPFVYEKIGNRYDHLMLDEAQDTSLMQWNNFRPLFRNSQASGGRNLVVGDVKQSIYRWRGSDWRLMSEKIRQDLDVGAFVPCSLRDNWRSDRAIINFNNALFSAVGSIIARDTTRTVPTREVQRIYPDESDSLNTCVQLISPERENVRQGYVRVTFLPKAKDSGQTWQEEALQRMIEDIRSLEKEGYALKDITVLVRTNKQGAMVADALIDAGISVLTEDSLLIGSSPCISRLMAVLSLRVKPEDPVSGLLARPYKHLLSELKPGSLYETCEQLLGSGCFSQSKEDLPYILAFLDAVLSYQEKYGSSLRGFVKWWEDSGRNKKICAPNGQNAVRIMTIHKSKGLSLDAVIIPFCKGAFSASYPATIWCRTYGTFADLGLIPLKATGELAHTCFAREYEEERTLQHIDTVNNWYVAFTRAKSRLLVYAPMPNLTDKKGKTSLPKPSSFENVLLLHLHDKLDKAFQYVSGTREPFVPEEDKQQLIDDPMPAFAHVTMGTDRLKLTLHSDDYFAQEKSARLKGIDRHREMALVEVDETLEAQSGHHHWFDGTYRVMNEASIVDTQGEIHRPDRVLVARDNSRVVIIDYKFGHPLESYKYQVRDYVHLMKEMGYPSVEGWLWYVTDGKFVRV